MHQIRQATAKLTILIGLSVCSLQAYGQSHHCTAYNTYLNELMEIRSNDPINYAQHQLKSNETANSLELCLQERLSSGQVGDEEFVKTTYMIGKLYRDGGKCQLAYDYFLKCMENEISKILKEDLYRRANTLKNTCVVPVHHANARGDNYRVRIATYSGKGGLTRNYFLNEIDLNEYTDDTPYLSDEIETFMSRKYTLKDSTEAIKTFMALSNAKYYVLKPPFLLLLANNVVYQNTDNPVLGDGEILDGEMMEATYGQFERKADKQYLNKMYQNLVSPALEKLTVKYFNQFNSETIIPIYVFDHPFTGQGAKLYAEFTNKIHFRKAAGKVGYYNQFDGSMMTWINSGGGTFIHEFVHMLSDHDGQKQPLPYWLNEGLASLYEETNYLKPLNNWRLVYIKMGLEIHGQFADISNLLEINDFQSNYQRIITDAYVRYFCKFLLDRGVLSSVYQDIKDSEAIVDKHKSIKILESHLTIDKDSIQQLFACYVENINDFGSWNLYDYTTEVKNYISDQKGYFPLSSAEVNFSICPRNEIEPEGKDYLEYDPEFPAQQMEQNQMIQQPLNMRDTIEIKN